MQVIIIYQIFIVKPVSAMIRISCEADGNERKYNQPFFLYWIKKVWHNNLHFWVNWPFKSGEHDKGAPAKLAHMLAKRHMSILLFSNILINNLA